jgi:glycosyltransferase involved in cell wall biosynthesis
VTKYRPVVLAPCDYFFPGYKAGGPIQTIAGVAAQLQEEFLFRVITRDRDLGDSEAYSQFPANTWQALGATQIMYLPPTRLGLRAIRRLIADTDHDILYLNSFFSVPFTIVPLLLQRFGLIPHRPVILGPRGELGSGALGLKSGKKRLYIAVARILGLTRSVVWQASGTHEARDIQRSFGSGANVVIAPDLATVKPTSTRRASEKKPNHLRLLFLSRISRIKNLDGALMFLRGVPGEIHFSIFGPIEDAAYWTLCQTLMAELPPNITTEYGGALTPESVGDVMAQHDLLYLPTHGEAFGHVILEALAAGCPVLISDRTRWRGLEAAGVGWDLSLENPEAFRDILRRCVAMEAVDWRDLSDRAREYASRSLTDPEAREKNRALFRDALRNHDSTAKGPINRVGDPK